MKQHIVTQTGSVLTVSMLILLVLTIIGVSALSNSVMEEKMSANFQNERKAFQAAESAINLTLLEIAKDEELLAQAEDAEVNQESAPSRQYKDAFSDAKTSQKTVIHYNGFMVPKNGSKINVGHANTLAWHSVKVTATGSVDKTNAQSTHVQGVMKGPLAK